MPHGFPPLTFAVGVGTLTMQFLIFVLPVIRFHRELFLHFLLLAWGLMKPWAKACLPGSALRAEPRGPEHAASIAHLLCRQRSLVLRRGPGAFRAADLTGSG